MMTNAESGDKKSSHFSTKSLLDLSSRELPHNVFLSAHDARAAGRVR